MVRSANRAGPPRSIPPKVQAALGAEVVNGYALPEGVQVKLAV